jgi:phosphoglycerol transferase MdoB-like AlkP superfamily enzyme
LKKRFIALISYLLFWLVFFLFARIFFMLWQFGELKDLSLSLIAGAFIHGFKMDLSAASYLMLLPSLSMVPELFFAGNWQKIFLKSYSFILIIFFTCIIIGDAIVYSYWGFRMESSIMEYLKTPGDAAASASTLQIIIFIILAVLISGTFIISCNRLINKLFSGFEKVRLPIPCSILLTTITAALVIPIRGGFGVAVINAGSVYFSDNLFPNHSAINVIWNFGHSAAYSKPVKNPYLFNDMNEAMEDMAHLLRDTGPSTKVLNTDRPNVLIIILESFGSYLVNQSAPDSIVTPRFREYIHEGIYFSNLCAAGSRTDKAIPAIFSGYPNLPTIQVIKENRKTQKMPGIIKLLDSVGYKTSFWYGGDINFANMNSFMTTSKFRQKITKDDFDPKNYNSKWGVHDEILLNQLQDSLAAARQPFAYSVLTLSSHEPFEVPMETVFKGRDVLNMFKNSIYYTDRSLGMFLDKAKTTDWWSNTIIILIADHCRRNSEKIPVYSEEIYRIPMLWLGGALSVRDLVIEKNGNQVDLPLTLANQLGIKSSFTFSKDLFSQSSASFSFYAYNEGFAFITDTSAAIYDVKLKKNVVERGNDPGSAARLGKSFLQVLFEDYLRK